MGNRYIVENTEPVKPLNKKSDWAFLFGLVSLMPCMGMPFGPVSVLLGRKARGEIKAGSGETGAERALAGMVCAGISIVFHAVMAVFAVWAMVAK